MINWGRVSLGTVLPFMFGSYDGATGASETSSGLAVTDIEIYKAGGGLTQRSSDAGYTLADADGHDLDSIVGLNGFTVDTGDNTDNGFFVAGGYYIVVVSAVTVDTQTVSFVCGTFNLGPALTVAGVEEVDVTHWLGTAAATPTVAGVPEVDVTHWIGTAAATPTVAGVPEVDLTHLKGVSATTNGSLIGADATLLASTLPDAYIRTAVGLASANLDTQLGALPTGAENAAAMLAVVYEGTETFQDWLRGSRAVKYGENTPGSHPLAPELLSADGMTVRVAATLDPYGNRSNVVTDFS